MGKTTLYPVNRGFLASSTARLLLFIFFSSHAAALNDLSDWVPFIFRNPCLSPASFFRNFTDINKQTKSYPQYCECQGGFLLIVMDFLIFSTAKVNRCDLYQRESHIVFFVHSLIGAVRYSLYAAWSHRAYSVLLLSPDPRRISQATQIPAVYPFYHFCTPATVLWMQAVFSGTVVAMPPGRRYLLTYFFY